MTNNISDKDKKDWQNFLSKTQSLPNKDSNYVETNELQTKFCDLHGYSLDEANKKIEQLINNSYQNGIHKLVIITGKGLHSNNENDPYVSKEFGILKNSVPEYILNSSKLKNLIKDIKEASIEDGGSGAFYIFLKKKL